MIQRVALAALILVCTACERDSSTSAIPEHNTDPIAESVIPEGQLSDSVVPIDYDLYLSINPRESHFSGTSTINVTIAQATSEIFLHGKNLEVSSASVIQNNSRIEATYEQVLPSGVASLKLAEPVESGQAIIEITYRAAFNKSSNALYSVSSNGHDYAATQFQPVAARNVFPSFDDPRFKVPFRISITAIEGDVVVTTTPETSSVTKDGMTTHTFRRTRPLPTYLLAFVVGPYDVVTFDDIPPNDVRSRALPLRGVAAKGQGEKLNYALSHTAGILNILESYFNIPYPYAKLDIIATPAGFGGAMENVGAIIYDEYLLLLEDNSPINQKRAFYTVHAHELAHMWFGNLVTPDWWTDIWLNESFATWMSYKVAHEYWPEGQLDKSLQKAALFTMQSDSLISAREVREHITHNDQIIDSFDDITYRKGGGVLGMIEKYAGDENFQNGIRHHLNRYADGSANAPQFMESLAQGAELAEIQPVFASFISQAGIPLIEIDIDCEDRAQLTLSQKRYAPLGSEIDPDSGLWQVPVCINAITAGKSTESCHLLDQPLQTFDIGSTCPDYVHPNAEGAGYYRYTMSDDDWKKLIANAGNLSSSEALSMLDSIDAAFRAGSISEQLYLNAMKTFINHDDWNVVDSTTNYLEALTEIFTIDDMPRVELAYRKMAADRFQQASAQGPEILYERMQRFMLIIARDPSLRKPMAEKAAAFVGLEGEPDFSAIEPGQMETLLSIGVQDLGEPFFDKLLELALASDNPAVSSAAFGALARTEDPELVSKLQSAAMNENIKGTRVTGIIFRQMARLATTQLTYEWIMSDPVNVLSLVPETFRPSTVPALGGFFCSSETIRDWESLLREHESLWQGYQRSMRQTVETNMLCEGLRGNSRARMLQALNQG